MVGGSGVSSGWMGNPRPVSRARHSRRAAAEYTEYRLGIVLRHDAGNARFFWVVSATMAVTKKKKVAKTTYSAPALEKGFDIIELLATAPDGLTSSDIAQKLGRSLSEIFRILVVMERRRWLHKSESDRYAVSYHVLETAFRASPVQALGAIAGPVMYELSQATVQSCHMVVLSDTHGLIVQLLVSSVLFGFVVWLGLRFCVV